MPNEAYRLASGVFLAVVGSRGHLVRVQSGQQIAVDPGQLAVLNVALSAGELQNPTQLAAWLAEGLLEPGAAGPDPIIETLLRELDAPFMAPYVNELSSPALRAYECLVYGHSHRKILTEHWGQCPALPETVLRRCLPVGDAAVVGKKHILCIGDDDLVSLGLAALGHKVLVAEIAPKTVALIRHVALERQLDIDVVEHDVRRPLQLSATTTFDAFFTDPMSNKTCIALFLLRGFEFLAPNGVGYCAVYGAAAQELELVQQAMGIATRRHWLRHNRYVSRFFTLHEYESDWLELAPTANLNLPAAEQFFDWTKLYHDAYTTTANMGLVRFENITDIERLTPLHFRTVVDVFAAESGLRFEQVETVSTGSWTILSAMGRAGRLVVRGSKPLRLLEVVLDDLGAEHLALLQRLVGRLYKPGGGSLKVDSDGFRWEVAVQ